jgi:hypothetical protein
MSDKLTWKKVSRQTYTAPVGDGYYEIMEHRAGKWGCKLSHPDSSSERGAYATKMPSGRRASRRSRLVLRIDSGRSRKSPPSLHQRHHRSDCKRTDDSKASNDLERLFLMLGHTHLTQHNAPKMPDRG